MVERWAMINTNGYVENICLWDGDLNKWQPPVDIITVKASNDCGIGWFWNGENFIPPASE